MSTLRIWLLGTVRITHDDLPPTATKLTPILQALLSFLLLQRSTHHPREVLAGLFWGDRSETQARGCLSTALWRLRHVLEPEGVPHGTYLIVTPSGEIGFNCRSQYWLDVEVFEKRVERVLSRPIPSIDIADAQGLERSLQLYSGDLLEALYDDWLLPDRERLRTLYLRGLAHLMRYYRHHGARLESLTYGAQILRCDPLREEIHREVMRLYLETGQRALALKQYEICREILAAELGINPMEETQRLYAQMTTEAHEQLPPPLATESTGLQQALQQFHLALRNLDEAREQFERATQLVDRFVRGLS
jgi:DNA-binding SARP family transcriptional activator